MLQTDPHQFSWLREVGIPVLSLILGAVLGAGLSFVTSEQLEERKAKLDEQKEKQANNAFLRAIGMELDALNDQFFMALEEVNGSTERAKSGTGPQIAANLRTSVFTSQLGKVRDVDDPLMVQVIHFYSDLGNLQKIIDGVNSSSIDFVRAEAGNPKRDAQVRLLSTLRVLQEQISSFGGRLSGLRAKLPPAGTPGK